MTGIISWLLDGKNSVAANLLMVLLLAGGVLQVAISSKEFFKN